MFLILGCSVLLTAAVAGAANRAGPAYPPTKVMHRGPTARRRARAAFVDRARDSRLEHQDRVDHGPRIRGAVAEACNV